MNSFRIISRELKSCISNSKYFKPFAGFESIIVIASLVVLFLNAFSGFGEGFGGILKVFAFWFLMLGIVIAYSNLSTSSLYLGLFGYSLLNIFKFFRCFVLDGDFLFSPIFTAAFFAWMGCCVVREKTGNKADI